MEWYDRWMVFAALSVATLGAVQAQAKPAFEVAVVRPSPPGGASRTGPTADGYQMANLPMLAPILQAYVPTGGGDAAYFTNDRVRGAPDWARSERYDIDARIPEADLIAWHAPATQKSLLQAMLQTLLADRCKLLVHRETEEIPVYQLVTGKNGPRLVEATPVEPHAGGIPMPGGAILVPGHGDQPFLFYNATMVTLAQFLSNFAGRPVQDKTGLGGRYDFNFDAGAIAPPPPPGPDGATAADPRPSLFSVVQVLGLRLDPARAQVEKLVIDRMERPAKN